MIICKEQELQVLEKIEKMVSELGDDSYVAAAFEGCFDMARTNIQNDCGCSLKQEVDSYAMKLADSEKVREAAERKASDIATSYQELASRYDRLERNFSMISDQYRDAYDSWRKHSQKETEYFNLYKESQKEVEDIQRENQKLKAMLFDYMMKDR